MKKLIIIGLIISANVFSMTVYDPANHQQNMQNYQMMVLQRMEMYKNYTENLLQTQNQLMSLKNEGINLADLSSALLGAENQALIEGIINVQKIADNSNSILRNQENFDDNINLFQNIDRLKGMSSEELKREGEKLTKEVNANLKTSLELANNSAEQIKREQSRLNRFSSQTVGTQGNLQTQKALKQLGEDQSNKLARIENLSAEQLRLQALMQQIEETERDLVTEKMNRKFAKDKERARNIQF